MWAIDTYMLFCQSAVQKMEPLISEYLRTILSTGTGGLYVHGSLLTLSVHNVITY